MKKKGQLTFEFIVAAVLFFAILLYVINFLITNVSSYRNEFYTHDLQIKAIQISELLVYNKGVWVDSVPKLVGLAQDWPVLDYSKIQKLHNYCSTNYAGLLERLDLRRNKINIQINDSDNILANCGPSVPTGVPIAEMQRFAVSSENNKILTLGVWIW